MVAPGTYQGAGNTDIDTGGKAITVLGSGGAAVRATPAAQLRDGLGAPTTTIDCEGPPTAFGQLCRGFVFHSGEGSDTIVSGFHILHGHATGSSSVTVDAYGIAGGAAVGGCVLVAGGATPTLRHMTFTSGYTTWHGGCLAIMQLGSHPLLFDVAFGSCRAGAYGGAIYTHKLEGSVSLEGGYISSCSGTRGGGIALGQVPALAAAVVPTFLDLVIDGCESRSAGGGGMSIYAQGVVLGDPARVNETTVVLCAHTDKYMYCTNRPTVTSPPSPLLHRQSQTTTPTWMPQVVEAS